MPTCFSYKTAVHFYRRHSVDWLLLCLIVLFFIQYRYDMNLAPIELITLAQLGAVWIACRALLYKYPQLSIHVQVLFMLIGIVEADWGVGQLYNLLPSNHNLFKTTGSFPNSGPYGGFIALVLPMALFHWLSNRQRSSTLTYISLLAGILSLLILPATLSRTAWAASTVSCAVVIVSSKQPRIVFSSFLKRIPLQLRPILFSITILTIGVAAFHAYQIKKRSADGRLFMWKITALAIKDSSFGGVGLGGFQAAYANAQMDYFQSSKATAKNKLVAGSPEYAFNEYLRIFLEQGVVGLILLLLLTFLIIRKGLKNGQVGAAAGFTSLSLFAAASYPYSFWEFALCWMVLGVLCISKPYGESDNAPSKTDSKAAVYLAIFSLLALVALQYFQHQYSLAQQEWERLRPLYSVKAYRQIVADYQRLYPMMSHNPAFVFEYALTLNGSGFKKVADSVLSRGAEISCDPMFYNVRGRNLHELGRYREAEESLLKSISLLPDRIYPHYLLVKLYADPLQYRPQEMKRAAAALLAIKPKVHSNAVDEMRSEVILLLNQKRVNHKMK